MLKKSSCKKIIRKPERMLYVVAAGDADSDAEVMNELKRPLSRRGVAEVLTLLEELKENPILLPELILCSPSLYVRQTMDLLYEVFGAVETSYRDALYAAPDYRILEMIHELDDIFFSVMVVGELPGLKQFIKCVSGGRKKMILGPADGMILSVQAQDSWHDFGCHKARRRPLIEA